MSGGFLARGVFVQGVFVRGFMSGGFLSGGVCPDTSMSIAEAIQYCGVKFLNFLYLADIANQKLSTIYNFETKIALGFYCNWQLR